MPTEEDPLMTELVPAARTSPGELARLDGAIHDLTRTVSLDDLRASGRRSFRVVSRQALMHEVLSVVEVFLEHRIRQFEQELGSVVEEREQTAHEEGRLRVLESLVDLADLADAVIAKLAEGDGAAAGKALDRRIDSIFRTHGFERIPTVGHGFDPEVHEIVSEEDDPSQAPEHVIREIGRGYRRDGYVLRIARVVINGG